MSDPSIIETETQAPASAVSTRRQWWQRLLLPIMAVSGLSVTVGITTAVKAREFAGAGVHVQPWWVYSVSSLIAMTVIASAAWLIIGKRARRFFSSL